jgi:hypothetical protein
LCVALIFYFQRQKQSWAKYLKVDKTPVGLRGLQMALLLLAVIVAYWRMNNFDTAFAREMFLNFNAQPECAEIKVSGRAAPPQGS